MSLFQENEDFWILLDLVYTLCMVPPEEVIHAFESVVEPYHEDHLADSEDYEQVFQFMAYLEKVNAGEVNVDIHLMP